METQITSTVDYTPNDAHFQDATFPCSHIYVGRVLNRFSKDLGFMDDILPFFFFDYLGVSEHDM